MVKKDDNLSFDTADSFSSFEENAEQPSEEFGSGKDFSTSNISDIEEKMKENSLDGYKYKRNSNGFYTILKLEDENTVTAIIPDCVEVIADSAFENTSVLEVQIPSSVRRIGAKAFKGCKELVSLEIPSSVLAVGDEAFADCPNLEVILPSSVKIIGKNVSINSKLDLLDQKEKARLAAIKEEENKKKKAAEKKAEEERVALQKAQEKAKQEEKAKLAKAAKEAEEAQRRADLAEYNKERDARGPIYLKYNGYIYFGCYPYRTKSSKVKLVGTPDENGVRYGNDKKPYARFDGADRLIEPIMWDIIAKDSDSYTLMSHYLICYMPFSTTGAEDYEDSDIAEYLDQNFTKYFDRFELDQCLSKPQLIDNSDLYPYLKSHCSATDCNGNEYPWWTSERSSREKSKHVILSSSGPANYKFASGDSVYGVRPIIRIKKDPKCE